MHMYKHTFTQVHPYTINTHICTYTCMYAHTHIYIYIYVSQHVDHSIYISKAFFINNEKIIDMFIEVRMNLKIFY